MPHALRICIVNIKTSSDKISTFTLERYAITLKKTRMKINGGIGFSKFKLSIKSKHHNKSLPDGKTSIRVNYVVWFMRLLEK